MNVRLLITAGALSLGLGLSSTAIAQGMPMQGQPGMEQGKMGGDMGQDQRPMKRSMSKKKMKKSMKGQRMMRSNQRMNQGSGMQQDGMGASGGADDGM